MTNECAQIIEQTSHVTQAQIDSCIAEELDYQIGNKTTCVVLVLKNGFEVVGTSACVDPAKYDHEIGKSFARKRAVDKIWELEGYSLQSALQLAQCNKVLEDK